MMTDLKSLRLRFDEYARLAKELQAQSNASGGILENQDIWRLNYYRRPYLIRAPDDYVRERFKCIFSNLVDINPTGKISPTPALKPDSELSEKWTHILEETNSRAILRVSDISRANHEIHKYYEKGMPIGVKLFGKVGEVAPGALVKYSKSAHVRDMLTLGEFQISPASCYAAPAYNKATRDDELHREFIIPTYKEFLNGERFCEILGNKFNFADGDVSLVRDTGDFYLFSMCSEVDRRMPQDFESDAALIIRDCAEFENRIAHEMAEKLPEWKFLSGKIRYTDPYCDYKNIPYLEMTKHYSYQYQKEHRFVWLYDREITVKLKPIKIRIGPTHDIAKAVFLNQ